jgi:hypothetical protein
MIQLRSTRTTWSGYNRDAFGVLRDASKNLIAVLFRTVR